MSCTPRLRTFALLTALASGASAQFPPRFVSLPVAANWQQPVGVTYAPDGTLIVWEKAGLVWTVRNGVKSAAPVINIAEEVGNWRDYGMLGLALDPAFATNGRIYLSYVVDYHHLRWHGTSQYDPTANEYFHDTIGRITRYTIDTTLPAWTGVPNSRAVLVGESMTTGIPICHQSHGIGALRFGRDGTLLAVAGDGASYETTATGGPTGGSSNTALADGIIRPKEDVGAFRSQLVDSLSGKVMRIDPQTGDGLPSNPFYDVAEPRAPRSRVWGLGLRNPFRVTLQDGTGSTDPAAGDPGTLWIGDVGWNSWEELTVCDGPAQNFGWPLFEGLTPQGSYQQATTVNLDAPNPLNGTGTCVQPFLTFRSLLVQETLAVPSWPNPCDPFVQIPASLNRFMHARPLIDWAHLGNNTRAAAFQGNDAAAIALGAPGSPLSGPQFGGNSPGGAAWYRGTDFPAEYRDSLFFADFVRPWIRRVVFDAGGVPVEIRPFAAGTEVTGIVDLATDPLTGGLTYIRYSESGGAAQVRNVRYVPNTPPVAVATASASFGPVPLPVQLSSAGSIDPDGLPLTYLWDFGDGRSSTAANPQHVFDSTLEVTEQGTIVARMFELVPPVPTGKGNHDPEVIRDGDQPPAGNSDTLRQYDTYHAGAQGDFDWIGYEFPTPRLFRTLIFQEGIHFTDGGWFDQLGVEVYDAGVWIPVQGLTATPAYPGSSGVSYGTYRLDFTPTSGTRVRIVGAPGGALNYISVAELRVIVEDPGAATLPTRRDVSLTVSDGEGTASAQLIVSLNNTPPVVSITSPVDGSLYSLGGTITVPLTASVNDAEHSGTELACAWQTALHHNEHSHPEPEDPACTTTTQITPEGCDGNDYHFEITLTVTDAAGLATTEVSHMYPDCMPHPFCFGDGTGTACPCGNSGAPGRGCENSFGTGGGLLVASGSARIGADTLLLSVTGLPATAPCLYFQGTGVLANGAGVAFGDGLRCAGGTITRLGTRTAAAGASSMGAPAGDVPLSVVGQIPVEGGVRNYQVWYRNAAPFCTSSTFNLTNAVRITWIP